MDIAFRFMVVLAILLAPAVLTLMALTLKDAIQDWKQIKSKEN